jgi:hypothetical protein
MVWAHKIGENRIHDDEQDKDIRQDIDDTDG